MLADEIREMLEALKERFGDRRLHVFDVRVAGVEDGVCRLAGRVLDREAMSTLHAELTQRFPALEIDSEAVQTLRQPRPRLLTVATNLTDLKGAPSGNSETMSQVVAGWAVEQLQEEEGWLFVRQEDGYLGWLAKRRMTEAAAPAATHLVAAPVAKMYAQAEELEASTVSRLLAGTPVTVEDVRGAWGHVTLAGFQQGWLPLATLRACDALSAGLQQVRAQMVQDAYGYVGVPYLWGGISALGIDCSGYVQLLYRLTGIRIPRDADMQWHAGQRVEPPFTAGDLLFFGSGKGHRNISHVGMSLGGWRMIHSSGPRNGVYVDDVQEAHWLRQIFVGACSFIDE